MMSYNKEEIFKGTVLKLFQEEKYRQRRNRRMPTEATRTQEMISSSN